jgi:eukaryotic-like serine/threonine-protein kinase
MEEQVLGFVEGRLSSRSIAEVDAHLNACASCGALVVEVLRMGTARRQPLLPMGERGCWTFEPGSCVAERYQVQRSLGRGGMGEVYEAIDLELQRTVALKTTRVAEGDQPEATERLSSEARLARRICPPNVCRVHEVGVHQDIRPYGAQLGFMSMEYIEGQSLAHHLRQEAVAPRDILTVARQLFVGLSAIHAAGVIHRDIKSHNVMLRAQSDEPSLVIIDFGLAVDVTGKASDAPLPPGHSGSFSFEGSPAYMAPEQFRDVVSTPATDVFACGVVLFESLTRMLPFRSLRPEKRRTWRDPAEVPLRAATITPNVPPRLDAFIARCLELDPARRFMTAEQALDGLYRLGD